MANIDNIELFSQSQTIVCDMDGTLYLDNTALPHSHDFLYKILESGRQLFYFTNNTSQSRVSYVKKLSRLGFPAEDRYLITAADCAEFYLRTNNCFPRIYLVGNRDLVSDFTRRGFVCLSDEEALKKLPSAVVLGFDTELTYQKIWMTYDLILNGIPYMATHADLLCPVAKGRFKPDVGSFISMFETATGGVRPVVVGKPNKEAVDTICDRAGQAPERIVFVGDRLYTDIRMAHRNNMVGVLVLSGETNREMLARSEDKPKIVVESVGDLIDYL